MDRRGGLRAPACACLQRLLSGQCDGFVVDELLGLYYLESGLSNDAQKDSWCALQQKGDRVLPSDYGVAFNRNLPTSVKGAPPPPPSPPSYPRTRAAMPTHAARRSNPAHALRRR